MSPNDPQRHASISYEKLRLVVYHLETRVEWYFIWQEVYLCFEEVCRDEVEVSELNHLLVEE